MSRQTRAKKHVHKYYRRPDGLWACGADDGCTHYMPTNMAPAPQGHASKCWECGYQMTLTSVKMEDRSGYPKCDDCSGIVSTTNLIDARMIIGQMKLDVKNITPMQRNILMTAHRISDATLDELKRIQVETEQEMRTQRQTEYIQKEKEKTRAQVITEVDEVESEYIHSPDCASWNDKECDCQ